MREAKLFDSYKDSAQARHFIFWVQQHGVRHAEESPAEDNMNPEANREPAVPFPVQNSYEASFQHFLSIRF